MKNIITFCAVMILSTALWSQNLKPVAQKVSDAAGRNVSFVKTELFRVTGATSRQSNQMKSIVADATVLEFRSSDAQNIVSAKPGYLNFIIPVNSGSNIELQLFQSTIFTPDFTVATSGNNGQQVSYSGGVHYWGIIKGDNSSIAAISIFNDQVMGIISSSSFNGNLVLGMLENDPDGMHMLYNDKMMNAVPPMECFTANDNVTYSAKNLQNSNKVLSNCIRLFWEVNYDIYQGQGSVANAANYVTGLFNQSAIIYANDGIPVELSEVFVWNTTSPYTSSSTSGQLSLFQQTRNTINGDLGHLLGYTGGGGIAAGFSGICASNLDASQCYSKIYASYSNVPTYSWSVEVVTHEQGHLMGSRHTHACVWNGNGTAIDNCGPTAGYGYEGSCSGAPTPTNGGTIMSYCHLVGGVGINFSNGFGTQPKNVIINNYNNGACLSACIGTTCMPSANMSTATVLTTTAIFNWAAVTGATNYNIRYRIVGTSTWSTATSASTPYNATSLTPGANYEWQVSTVCAGGSSIYTISTTFTTQPLNCVAPTNLSTTNITSSSATFNWTAASGATSYNLQYRIVGTSTWTTGTSTTTSFNAFSLTSVSNYEWQIQTLCSGGSTSSFSSSVNFTTLTPPCNYPQNIYTTNIASTSATLNWSALTGGVSYTVHYRIVGTSTWTTASTASFSYNATGLTPLSNYEWQIMTICTGGQSAFSYSSLFNTLCATPSATITANGLTIFCAGGSVLLTASSGTGYTYQWLLNGSVISGIVSMNYSANASGNYSVVVISGTCSATSASITVDVNPLPTVTAANVSGCAGTAIVLSGTPVGGTWSVTNPYTGSSTTYTHTYTDANGCTNSSAAATITVNPLPTVTADNVSGCAGTAITLSGTPAGGTWSVANPYTGSSTTYTHTYTDANGCTNTSSSATITVNPLPTVSFSGLAASYTITSPSATLTGVPAGGTFSGPGISGNTFSPSSAGAGGPYTITYSYADANGCSNSSTHQTTVTNCTLPAQPGAIKSIGGNTKVCPGDSKTYYITAVSGATSYTWTPPAGATVTAGQGTTTVTVNYTPNFIASGTLSVVTNNTCGSGTARTLAVTRNTPATPGVITGQSFGVCNLSNVPYSVVNIAGITYSWSFSVANASIVSGQGTNAVTATYGSAYLSGFLLVTANNACGASAARTLAVKSNPATPPSISGPTLVCSGQQSVPYSIAPITSATSYTWTGMNGSHISDGVVTSVGNVLTTTSTSVTVNFGTATGKLNVRANNACGTGLNVSLTVGFNCRLSETAVESLPDVSVFPNPSTGAFTIQFAGKPASVITIEIMDNVGKVLKSFDTNEETIIFDQSNFAKGIYYLSVKNANDRVVKKIVIL
ncbi:MAG: fibronectin type III domain-containing protein [Bacteroidia bacterium]